VDPVDFYHQALHWHADASDLSSVTARSIVSRAYYAAILVARDAKHITATRNTHETTIEAYRRGSAQDVSIGNRLDGLRVYRTNADYDMTKPCMRREAGEALTRSRNILGLLGVSLPPRTLPPPAAAAPAPPGGAN
jgi:hypothetical protein